jgi:hypothetical protein
MRTNRTKVVKLDRINKKCIDVLLKVKSLKSTDRLIWSLKETSVIPISTRFWELFKIVVARAYALLCASNILLSIFSLLFLHVPLSVTILIICSLKKVWQVEADAHKLDSTFRIFKEYMR